MNASDDLRSAYADWRKLTEAEGEAIQSAQWPLVERCQAAKAQLQSVIVSLSESAAAQWRARGFSLLDFEAAFRDVISELIRLETANAAALTTIRQKAEDEFAAVQQSNANLRNIRRGYAQAQMSGWQSYC